jgi:hypothetical protein
MDAFPPLHSVRDASQYASRITAMTEQATIASTDGT